MPFERHEVVRVGLVGTGRRQRSLLRGFLEIDGVEITALCDVVRAHAVEARSLIEAAGGTFPAIYGDQEGDFEAMLDRNDIDLVCVASPWEHHVAMATAAMEAGKHVCVEVPAATTVEGCWQLVEASERTRRHCVMLENCCYGYNELLILNMVRAGMFGELLHGEAAYIHDLRANLFSDKGAWRRRAHVERNGNLYPTHGLGPVAMYMGVNRGDRFETLVSMSSSQRGLDQWRADHVGRDSPMWRETYRCGDINTSIISTARGRTIVLKHEVVNPRPYDRLNLISGTRGIFQDFPPRIYLEGQEGEEEYTGLDPYRDRFEHALWRVDGARARRAGGHGGMDFIMLLRLVDCMRQGVPPDMDVYDAASWSVPGPLSEASVMGGSTPVRFPDFTRDGWKDEREVMGGSEPPHGVG